ncbi:MAG: polysaccharide deacetylase family protein, partial [Bacteroidales bacterium]|nr:polysaccharide deacetylase family protein [Bacteroidales bacterium]
MKIIRTIIPALCALILFSCAENAPKENVFEYDEFEVVTKINPDEKCVWLVFTAHYSLDDDGYFENFDGVVPVLNTLKEKEVKGSFFPTGVCFEVEKYQDAVRRIIDEGHYLSSHSFNHLLLCDEKGSTLVSADSIKADFALMEASLEKYG